MPNGVDAARFLRTLEPHGEDDPVDAEYMRWLTDRVSMPYARALATDPVLSAIKGAWDESRIALGERPDPIPGMDADTDGADAGDGDADGDGGAGLPAASPDTDSQPSGPVMDAHELARLMRA